MTMDKPNNTTPEFAPDTPGSTPAGDVVTMDGCKLVVAIVDRNQGDRLVSTGKEAGATGGTILLGRGTARSDLMQILGFGDSRKDIVLILTMPETTDAVIAAWRASDWVRKKVRGVLFVIDVFALHRASLLMVAHKDDESMSATTTPSHEMIAVIVNAGYAEDIMSTARKAGATGGTILHGRGTAREEDSTFFGITIVPEKDVLLILAESSSSRQILEAVRNTRCLREPGMGIAFCMGVEHFVPLGGRS